MNQVLAPTQRNEFPRLTAPTPWSTFSRFRRVRWGEFLTRSITFLSAAAILILTVALAWELYRASQLSIRQFGFKFITSSTWDPVAEDFGAITFIFGTLVTSAIALLLAVPIGLGAAICLAELAPRGLSSILTFIIELLAAVPSVIIGVIGVFVLVPFMREVGGPALKGALGFLPLFSGPNYGVGVLTAGVLLAMMVLPFIISVSREVLLAVPREQREASMALGATRWETTWHVAMVYARSGIFGSIFLALARALGETMAVTMVIGNTPQISASLFAPGYSMAAVIANEFSEATGDLYLNALIEIGLLLFVITMIINALARLMIWATVRKQSTVV
ncbi:MAG: phosphate ABC transporter permease subunit PstC [Acidobacteriia bacterium]|nr:phosphate ABC transporter permease subunit PstC [Terriglobia bacterium]